MKRTLISYDAFKKIEEQSLVNAERELIQAQDVLAEALGVESLELRNFTESEVTYEVPDGTYIHATYTIKNDNVILENIEQLVVDEESERAGAHELISQMVDDIIDGKDVEATHKFEQYIDTPSVKRNLTEAAFKVTTSKPTGKRSKLSHRKQPRSLVAKRIRARLKTLRSMSPSQRKAIARQRAVARRKLGGTTSKRARVYARKVKASHMKEWTNLCENVYGYLNYKQMGNLMNETFVKTNENGSLSAISIPTALKRNEGKVLSLNYDTLNTDVKVVRNKMKNLKEDNNFARAMADLKRYNNISDNASLEATLEAIVTRWPDVLYVTEAELASQISQALEVANVKNYDDVTCSFMAEAILRTAHNAYVDRVKKIAVLAGAESDVTSECKECEDAYGEFKKVAESFYSVLDESEQKDLRVFADLFNALREVHEMAVEVQDKETVVDVEKLLEACASVLNRESAPSLELVEAAADYLNYFMESNVDGASNNWDVVTTPHHTVVGDHPVLSKWAKSDAMPSVHHGDWKSPAPVSDGKSYDGNLDDEMQTMGWSNCGGEDTWPTLDNPYLLKPADSFKMKEKSVVDDNDELGQNQSGDTWPNLKNPYCPPALGGDNKMSHE
jgi:hypothetical protein